MILTDGDVIALVTRPITLVVLVLAALALALPYAVRRYGRMRGQRELAELTEIEGA